MTIRLATAAQMREMDRVTIEERGIAGVDLMEAAGEGTFLGMQQIGIPEGEIAILCGSGNNGGDGFVVARHLKQAWYNPVVYLLTDPKKLKGDALTNFKRLPKDVETLKVTAKTFPKLSRRIQQSTCIVDGLLGTGLQREVQGLYADVIRVANAAGALRIAIDIPSGLNSDTGQIMGVVFDAHHTFTYGLMKLGMALQPGASLCGGRHVVDIGIPADVVRQVGICGEEMEESDCIRWLRHRAYLAHKQYVDGICVPVDTTIPEELYEEENLSGIFDYVDRMTLRVVDSHKGTYGHLMLMAGSPGKSGAAILAAGAGLRSGVGLLTCVTDAQTQAGLLCVYPEAMSELHPSFLKKDHLTIYRKLREGKTALAVGPGFGISISNHDGLEFLLEEWSDLPAVVDADALTMLNGNSLNVYRDRAKKGGVTVLTPHPGEAAYLLETTAADIQADRPRAAAELAERTQAIVVLKGAGTLITTPDGYHTICPFGNPGMATGGMGDVLTGLLGGLIAGGGDVLQNVKFGVCLHACAGDLAAQAYGQHGLIAGDVVQGIGTVWQMWESGEYVSNSDE